MESFEAVFRESIGTAPPDTVSDELKRYWAVPVSELVRLPPLPVSPAEKERHCIYALLLMAVVHHYWNGNKRGRSGEYPWNESRDAPDGMYLDRDYLGHNIAALAVDGDGYVVDFDFNHNNLFNSSAEHAEARLVRRVFGLTQVSDSWKAVKADGAAARHAAREAYTTFANVTIYTSLESCAQCSGIMALGRVNRVVYLQTDPGTYWIGRILRNLTGEKLRAPLPIAAELVGLQHFGELDAAFTSFKRRVKDEPFWISPDKQEKDVGESVTSFLCTKVARDIYSRATSEFRAFLQGSKALEHPDFRPRSEASIPVETALTNAEVMAEVKDFFDYAVTSGRRGTPHNV